MQRMIFDNDMHVNKHKQYCTSKILLETVTAKIWSFPKKKKKLKATTAKNRIDPLTKKNINNDGETGPKLAVKRRLQKKKIQWMNVLA